MHAPARFSSKPAVDAVRAVWVRIHTALLGTAITVTALVAATRIVEAFTILVNGESLGDVVDIFHDLVPRWFAGLPVYSYSTFAVHPPATYALLWPVFGRMDIGPARWLWIMLLVAALVWLVHITVRESGV